MAQWEHTEDRGQHPEAHEGMSPARKPDSPNLRPDGPWRRVTERLQAVQRGIAVRPRLLDGLLLASIAVAFMLLRLPFRSDFLVNWDAVNFALGVETFDVQHHQPHPPGYIGYIALARLLAPLFGETNTTLTVLSIVSGGVAAAAFYVLAHRFLSRRYALAATVLFGTSPLVWYYSSVALTYAVEAAVALPALWACHVARRERSAPHLILATVLLAFLGGLRQSGIILLAPVWLYAAWAFPWRIRASAAGGLLALNLVWLIPLIVSSGGLQAYLEESSALASAVGLRTSIFALNPLGLLQNIGFVVVGLLVGLGGGLAVSLLAYWRGVRPATPLWRADRWFFLLWALPSLATYLLLHTGQAGYILLVLPIGFLWIGWMLSGLHQRVGRMELSGMARPLGQALRRWQIQPRRVVGVVAAASAVALLVNVTGFFQIQAFARALASPEAPAVIRESVRKIAGEKYLMDGRVRQYSLEASDGHWEQITRFIEGYAPETVAVLALPEGGGSFRHLSYYLPDYMVYGIGEDMEGSFGHLFSAYKRQSDYSVQKLEAGNAALRFRQGISRLVIADRGIYERLRDTIPSYPVELPGGSEIVVAIIPEGFDGLAFTYYGKIIPIEAAPPIPGIAESAMG